MAPGSSLTVNCPTTLTVRVAKDKKSVVIKCAAVTTATATKTATATQAPATATQAAPTATATSVPPSATATSVAPTATATATSAPATATPTQPVPTATATSVPPTATATTVPPAGSGETFPAVNALTLGSCPAEVHDRYFVFGPDGRKYRTWHPVTVPINAANPNGPTCTFAHEHGDLPNPNGPNPAFGYAAAVQGMYSEIAAHAGFKVFSHYADGRSGLGTRETDYRGLPMDFTLTIHQGSAGAARITQAHHSLEFWSVYQGNVTHVYAMADTGRAFDKADGGGSDCCDRFIVSHEATAYETWGFQVNVGGAWNTGSMFAAVTNPMTHMHNIVLNPDGSVASATLANTSEEFCFLSSEPCNLPFGSHAKGENNWLGNFRTIHEPDWTWTNAGGEEYFCTDAMGMRMACGANTIRQHVPPVNLSNASASLLLRTNNEPGFDAMYWLPLGAPGGN